jgi:hypothetical protein
LTAFVGLRPAGLKGLHGNDIRTDNRLENLRWGTNRDNADDAIRNGRVLPKLTREKALEIVDLRGEGRKQPEIAKTLGVSQATIHCPYCSQQIKVNASGQVVPHRSGTDRCVASGVVGRQMETFSRRAAEAAKRRGKRLCLTNSRRLTIRGFASEIISGMSNRLRGLTSRGPSLPEPQHIKAFGPSLQNCGGSDEIAHSLVKFQIFVIVSAAKKNDRDQEECWD